MPNLGSCSSVPVIENSNMALLW